MCNPIVVTQCTGSRTRTLHPIKCTKRIGKCYYRRATMEASRSDCDKYEIYCITPSRTVFPWIQYWLIRKFILSVPMIRVPVINYPEKMPFVKVPRRFRLFLEEGTSFHVYDASRRYYVRYCQHSQDLKRHRSTQLGPSGPHVLKHPWTFHNFSSFFTQPKINWLKSAF